MWVESKGKHSLIHTTDKVYEALESVAVVAGKYADSLCRIHASYAVNPAYVAELERFHVRLDDGTRLNIPEKKYTKVKNEINRMLKELHG